MAPVRTSRPGEPSCSVALVYRSVIWPSRAVRSSPCPVRHVRAVATRPAAVNSTPNKMPTLSTHWCRLCRRKIRSSASGEPASSLAGQDAAELEFRKVCAHADGRVVLEFAEQPFADPLCELGIDVADRSPGGLVELYRADDRVAEQEGASASGGDDDTEMPGGVAGRHGQGDAGCHGRVAADGPQAVTTLGGGAEALPDVVEHQRVGVGDEVVPVARAEPDGGMGEERGGVAVEEPAAVVGVQVGAHDVGDVGRGDAHGAEAAGELTADEEPAGAVVAQVGPDAGVHEDRPVTGADEETADGQPGHSVADEQVLVA